MKLFLTICLLVSATLAAAQFEQVMLAKADGRSYPPVEPSIIINPKNPDNIVAGVVLDRVFYSFDGGATWSDTQLTSPYGVYGDPAVIANTRGHIFYFHLADPSGKGRSHESWLDMIVCQKSTDGGVTWSEGVAIGKNSPADQDKEWPAVSPIKNHVALTWTQFDTYGSSDPECHSNIMFSQSVNGGKKWSDAIAINQLPGDCIDDDNTTEGAVPAYDLYGRIFVAWSNGGKIYLDRSYDKGKTWLTNDLFVADHHGGWAMDIPGLQRANGMPVLMIDNGLSIYRGRMYVMWADQKRGVGNTDIWIAHSSNAGDYWGSPVRVNQDSTESHQFLPWMAVDPWTGHIYVLYYDRRNYDDKRTDVYLAASTDGGATFKEWKVSDEPFIPQDDKFFGDYTNISAHNGRIAMIWTRMDNGQTSVWTSVVNDDALK